MSDDISWATLSLLTNCTRSPTLIWIVRGLAPADVMVTTLPMDSVGATGLSQEHPPTARTTATPMSCERLMASAGLLTASCHTKSIAPLRKSPPRMLTELAPSQSSITRA